MEKPLITVKGRYEIYATDGAVYDTVKAQDIPVWVFEIRDVLITQQAEIAKLKDKLKENEEARTTLNNLLDKDKDTISRRNKQIADLSSKLKKATHCKMCGKPFETLTEVCYPCQVK